MDRTCNNSLDKPNRNLQHQLREHFPFFHKVQTVSEIHPPPIQWTPCALSQKKWFRCEADTSHSI